MSSEMREFREALQDCVRAMDVARDTIQPITTAQIRLHNLNPQTDKLLDDAAAKALALLTRTESGADRPVAEISELSGAKLIVLYSVDEIGHLPKGTKLYLHPQDASAVPVPKDNDGKEQDAFEAWAKSEGFDMVQHPLHWLFLNERTNAARKGWRGALAYVDAALHQPAKGGAL